MDPGALYQAICLFYRTHGMLHTFQALRFERTYRQSQKVLRYPVRTREDLSSEHIVVEHAEAGEHAHGSRRIAHPFDPGSLHGLAAAERRSSQALSPAINWHSGGLPQLITAS